MKNARTDAAFSLYKKNDSSGRKNQRFFYLRSTFSRMEKKPFKKVRKISQNMKKGERNFSCRIDFLYRETRHREISPGEEKSCIEKTSFKRARKTSFKRARKNS